MAPAASAMFSRAATLEPRADHFESLVFASIKAANEAELVAEAAAMLSQFGSRLLASPRLTADERAEVAVIDLETKQTMYDEGDELVGACRNLAAQTTIPSSLRLRAALAGARVAEHGGDPATVDALFRIADAIQPGSTQDAEVAQWLAIVHAVASRRLGEAKKLAESALSRSSGLSPTRACRAILGARVPFWFDCDFRRVTDLVRSAEVMVAPYPTSFYALRTRDVAATLQIELMELDEAGEAIGVALDLSRQYGYSGLNRNLDELTRRLMVAKRDVSTSAGDLLCHAPPGDSRRFHRLELFDLCNSVVQLARLGDAAAIEGLAAEVQQHWLRYARGCGIDYLCIAAAICVLMLKGRAPAQAFADQYFRAERTATGEPSPFSRALAAEFGLPIS